MVPILGQQFAILGFTLLPTLKCQCERGGIVTLLMKQGAAGVQRTQETCSSCGRLFTLQTVQITPDGNLAFGIEVSTPESEPSLTN